MKSGEKLPIDDENRTFRPVSNFVKKASIFGCRKREYSFSGTPAAKSRMMSAQATAVIPTRRAR